MSTDAIVWSNSKIKTWNRCHRQFEYKYVRGLRKKVPAVQLARGSWLHRLLQEHYLGNDWREVHEDELTMQYASLEEEVREEYGDLPAECRRIMTSYLAHWRKEDAREFTVVDAEVDEVLPLPNGDYFRFIIDLIVEEADGGLWLWDHKCVKNFMDEEFMLLDAQLTRYFWAAEKMGYTPLRGVMFNELCTYPPTIPAVLKTGGLSKKKNARTDVYTYLREIKRHGLEVEPYRGHLAHLKSQNDRWFRRTHLPRDSAMTARMEAEIYEVAHEVRNVAEVYTHSADKSCTWGCDFLPLCLQELRGGDTDEIIRLRYDRKEDDIEQQTQAS